MIKKFKNTLSQLFKSSFAKNTAVLFSGTVISQVISFLFYPIITRIYSPESFGVYVMFNSVLGMLGVLGALRYEFCIPIANTKKAALNAVFMCVLVLLGTNLILLLTLYFFGNQILSFFDFEALYNYQYFIVAGVLFTGLYSILNQWSLREKSFKTLSYTKVSRGLSLNLSQTLMGWLKFSELGLILGKVIGEGSGNVMLIRQTLKSEKNWLSYFSWSEVKQLMIRYKRFPYYTAPTQLLNKSGIELPVFFLTAFFGSSVVGYYGLAHLIVSLPMTLIGNAVGDVFYSEAATHGRKNPDKLLNQSNKLLKKLILIGIAPLLILLFLGPFLFGFVFGDTWTEAGEYAKILSWLVFFRLIFTPISRVFQVFEEQLKAFWIDLFRLILVLIVFGLVNYLNLNPFDAVKIYVVSMCLIYLITYFTARSIIKKAT